MKNKSKPIAYIVPVGKGLDSFVYREIETLQKLGQKIIIFATKYKKGDIYSPKDEWPCYTLTISHLFFQFPWLLIQMCLKPSLFFEAVQSKSLIDLVFATKFTPIMKELDVAQIHCHFGDHKLFIGYYCKKLTGLPLSVTIHSHELHVNPNEKMFKRAILLCDRIFAISQLAVDILITKYSVKKQRLFLNRLSLDIDIWTRNKPIRVISVGRFQPQKGFDVLFKAAKLLEKENIEFLVAGFGPLDVKTLANDEEIAHKIIFYDKLDQNQLRQLYQTCDIFCLPSITHPEQGMEGIPVVLMEAMACGMPVVATNTGAVNELVEEYLVPEKSPQHLAEAIMALVENSELREIQGRKNRKIVEQKHNQDNAIIFGQLLTELQCNEVNV